MQVRAEQEASKRGAGGGESDEEEAPALAKPVALPGAPTTQPVSEGRRDVLLLQAVAGNKGMKVWQDAPA